MHLERLERHVLAERQVTVAVLAAGGKAELPDLAAERARFDAELSAAPDPAAIKQASLLKELGVA